MENKNFMPGDRVVASFFRETEDGRRVLNRPGVVLWQVVRTPLRDYRMYEIAFTDGEGGHDHVSEHQLRRLTESEQPS